MGATRWSRNLAWMHEGPDSGTVDGVAGLHRAARRFFEFCVSDPVRYQLMFQRTIPDFVPSERSYAVAQAAYEVTVEQLAALGIDQPGVDLWTAVLAGLVAQQLANDPDGDRWSVLVDRAVDMLLAELVRNPRRKTTARRSR